MATHIRAMESHLSYGMTQRYLPPDTGERAHINHRPANEYSIYRCRRDGRLGWLQNISEQLHCTTTYSNTVIKITPCCSCDLFFKMNLLHGMHATWQFHSNHAFITISWDKKKQQKFTPVPVSDISCRWHFNVCLWLTFQHHTQHTQHRVLLICHRKNHRQPTYHHHYSACTISV